MFEIFSFVVDAKVQDVVAVNRRNRINNLPFKSEVEDENDAAGEVSLGVS